MPSLKVECTCNIAWPKLQSPLPTVQRSGVGGRAGRRSALGVGAHHRRWVLGCGWLYDRFAIARLVDDDVGEHHGIRDDDFLALSGMQHGRADADVDDAAAKVLDLDVIAQVEGALE